MVRTVDNLVNSGTQASQFMHNRVFFSEVFKGVQDATKGNSFLSATFYGHKPHGSFWPLSGLDGRVSYSE